MTDPLFGGLSDVADQVQPADLLDRSLRRSRRIGQRRTMTAAGVAGVLLVAGGSVAWTLGGSRHPQPAPAASVSASPSPSSSAAPSGTPSSVPSSSGSQVAGSVPGLTGWLYYRPAADTGLARLDGGKLKTVLTGSQAAFGTVSPDGTRVAAIAGTSTQSLIVTDRSGKNSRTLLSGVQGVGFEPAWSPDSSKILVSRIGATTTAAMGTVTVSSGTFTPLAHATDGIHYLWSADGRHLVFSSGTCQVEVADADGGNVRQVPIVGSTDTKVNPHYQRSCDPFSVSPDGRRVALDLRTGSQPDGDIGPDYVANAIVDTTTGHLVTLPVTGTMTAALFQPDGSVLVRTTHNGATTLTLLSSANAILAQVAEPPAAKSALLVAYRTQ